MINCLSIKHANNSQCIIFLFKNLNVFCFYQIEIYTFKQVACHGIFPCTDMTDDFKKKNLTLYNINTYIKASIMKLLFLLIGPGDINR